MTNFKRIKEMDIEEMAEFLEENGNCRACALTGFYCNERCRDGARQWLESEEEGNEK